MKPTSLFRVGTKVPINVYDGDRPVCQCHNTTDALNIVNAVNFVRQMPVLTPEAKPLGRDGFQKDGITSI